jgi:hypothetical protein
MALGLGMRSIWISLRAVNYTDRAFRQAIKNTEALSKQEEKAMQQMLNLRQEMLANVQAGVLYAAMGQMVFSALTNIMQATKTGASFMSEYNSVAEEFKSTMADAIFVILKPALVVLKEFMSLMSEHPAIARLAAIVGVLAGALLVLFGIQKAYNAVAQLTWIQTALQQALNEKVTISWGAHSLAVGKGALAYWALAGAMAASVGAFVILYELGQNLDPMISTFGGIALAIMGVAIAVATLKAILSGGTSLVTDVGAIVGLAAIGGGAGLAIAGMENYDNGTRMIGRTGPKIMHQGELVYNPRKDSPMSIGKQLNDNQNSPSITTINMNVANLNTKSDVEDLPQTLSKLSRRTMRNNR